MGYCTNCGHELGIGRFCTNCGQPIAGRHAGAPASPAQEAVTTPPAPPAPPAPSAGSLLGPTPPPARFPLYADSVAGPRPSAPPAPTAVATPASPPTNPADDARGRIGWLVAMIVGVTAIIAVVVGLVMVLDDGNGDRTAEDPGPGNTVEVDRGEDNRGQGKGGEPQSPDPSAEPGPVGDATSLIRRIKVPGTAPASTDAQTGEPVTFEADHLNDDDETTCWRVAGDATGGTLTVKFDEPVQVSEVGMVNGYAKSYPGYDGYRLNRRVLEVSWVFDDGTSVTQELGEDRAMQSMPVTPTWTKRLTIEIVEVSPPGEGPLGKDYTAISELLIEGATAVD